ncbi:MAG: type 4 prepilin peptidase 1, leader peptidase (prepilin peptidase) / N-methyltransferase [Candidatus Levybacteria bacterium]|nr:type 4 prepilin peptidase 1, leader peptidase (prepilin peptidase) / N-methyltransferase [Candidatus Levybacteria bacterium]
MTLFFIFIIGIFVGSFLNVLADRLPREETIIKGRSHCEKCKKELAWYDLIPLLSFIILKGKCRYCRTPLSFYYPVVEIITGLMFVITFLFTVNNFQFSIYNLHSIFNLQFTIYLIYYIFIVSSLIVVFLADMKYGIIPDKIIFPAILMSGMYLFIIHNSLFMIHFLSGLGAGLFFLALFLITKGRGMGFGDVKFAFLMGLILGFPNIVVSLYIAFLTGAVIGIILILWRRKKIFGTTIPFGPFLVFGTFLALFWGDPIFHYFLRLSGLN